MSHHQVDIRVLFLQLMTVYFVVCHVYHVTPLHETCQIRIDNQQGLTVDCSHLGLSKVPSNLPHDTRNLDLSFNNITSLDDNVFSSLKQLNFLDLSINPIEFLSVQTFAGLEVLYQLDMYGHALNYSNESVPYDVFKPLTQLQILNIRSSLVQSKTTLLILPDQALKHLDNLRSLNIGTASRTLFGIGFKNLMNLNFLNIGQWNVKNTTFLCHLNFITDDTFKVFMTLPIESLAMTWCSCYGMDIYTKFLEYFPDLINLNLYQAILRNNPASNILQALSHGGHNKTFSSIILRHYREDRKDYSDNYYIKMEILLPMCIKHLDISELFLFKFHFDALATMPLSIFGTCIKSFIISRNHLMGQFNILSLTFLSIFVPSLEFFDGSDQSIHRHMSPHFQGSPASKPLPVGLPFICPSNLTHVNIGGLREGLGIYPSFYVLNGQQLIYLNLSYSGLYRFLHPTIGIENLQVFDISGNDCRIITDNFFDTLPNLTTLAISNALLDNNYIMGNGSRLLSPLMKLESLDLSYNDLKVLPFTFFNSLTALRNLNLRNNHFVSIPDFNNLFSLKSIFLISNSLTILHERTTSMLDTMAIHNPDVTIFLDKNVFSCGCSALEFLLWLKDTHVNLDGRNYPCIDMDGNLTTTMSVYYNYTTYHRKCVSGMWLTLSTFGLSCVVISILLAFLVVKNKMKLKLLLLRMIGRYIYPKTRDEFLYDAYVVYPNAFYRLACVDMVRELETNRRLKLNLSDRDHLPGGSEVENIYEAMNNSWKIILIWTEEFFQNDLSFFIMCNCVSSITLTTPHRLIILFDDQFESPANTHFLLESITEENILHVDLRNSQRLDAPFWNRLFNCITYREPDH